MIIKNTHIVPSGNGTWLIRADTDRFGPNGILYESHDKDECLEYFYREASPGSTTPEGAPFILRPAAQNEYDLFYSSLNNDDEVLGTVGHLRFDYGRDGDEFWHTWWPHNDDALNTPEFKAELSRLMGQLRTGMLKTRSAMSAWCRKHQEGHIAEKTYCYVAEAARYRFHLRCTTRRGDYSYLYIYDQQVAKGAPRDIPASLTEETASSEYEP